MFVQVAVNVPHVSGVFDYHIPPDLAGKVTAGHLVSVPFGRQTVQGIVLGLTAQAQVMETRPVFSLLDEIPVVNAAQVQICRMLADSTLSPLAACLSLFLPPGLGQKADTLFRLAETPPGDLSALAETQKRIVSLLQERGPLRSRQIETALGYRNWKEAARRLVKSGWLVSTPVLPAPRVHSKKARMVQLAVPPKELVSMENGLGRGEAGARRQRVVEFLKKEPWPVLVSWVYAQSGANAADLETLVDRGFITLTESEVWRDPLEQVEWVPFAAPTLTSDQETVWTALREYLERPAEKPGETPLLLHGVTGSGKTEIYLRAIESVIAQGKQAVFLVPEIALTPQTIRRVVGRFPGKVGLAHSRLSAGERYDTWRRIRSGALPVVVGPRSALFSPFPNLGLIVIDEFHENSYFQAEPPPAYHAVDAALLFSRAANVKVILGSATPPVSLYYRARLEKWPILSLPNRVLAHRQAVDQQLKQLGHAPDAAIGSGETAVLPLPPVQVIDMRSELKEGNRSIFSRALQKGLADVLDSGQQAILFLNRRGSASYVFCRDCGYVARCARCDSPLTLHTGAEGASDGVLICHTCNYRRKTPRTCPRCGSPHIRHYGSGTEKVEKEVQGMFPGARTLRWDAETTRYKGAHEIILSHFVNHRADILVGTQMLAKGLDLPLVTLVGAVLADVGLNFPDYLASERTFQLLTQVAGRAGRSPLGGQVILQTFQPEAYPIQTASRHDYFGFYEMELKNRRLIEYPPFSRLIRFEVQSLQAGMAETAVKTLAERIQYWIDQADCGRVASLIGPAPCFFQRVNGQYRWQVILRAPDPLSIIKGKDLPANSEKVTYRIEVSPVDLL